MPPSSELLHEVKSQQNVLIARAGLSVPGHEMHGEDINTAMFTQFKYHVLNTRHNLDAPENTFLRSSRHLDATWTRTFTLELPSGGNTPPLRNTSTIISRQYM